MKKSKFTDSQIMEALKCAEAGVAVAETCRKLGIARRADSGARPGHRRDGKGCSWTRLNVDPSST